MVKFLTDKWGDEPRQLTDFGRITILVVVLGLLIFGSVKVCQVVDRDAENQLNLVENVR